RRSGSPAFVRFTGQPLLLKAAMSVNDLLLVLRLRYAAGANGNLDSGSSPCGLIKIVTSSFAFAYGNERNNTALTTLKMAVFAPMPSARVTIASTVNAGFFSNIRTP